LNLSIYNFQDIYLQLSNDISYIHQNEPLYDNEEIKNINLNLDAECYIPRNMDLRKKEEEIRKKKKKRIKDW
jgi:hypothetical protein